VRQYRTPRARECRFGIARGGRVERGKNDVRFDAIGIAGLDDHVGDERWHVPRTHPAGGFSIRLAGRSFGRGARYELEPRMPHEQTDERLPHGTGRAEDRDASSLAGTGWRRVRGHGNHAASRVFTIFLYDSTAAFSSRTLMNSPGVCATWIEPG